MIKWILLFILIPTMSFASTDFNGTTDRIDYANFKDFDTGNFSVCMWAYHEDVSSNQYLALSQLSGDASNGRFLFWHSSFIGGAVSFTFNTSSSTGQRASATGTVSINTWHHFCSTTDNVHTNMDGTKMYIDGSEITYDTDTDGSGTATDGSGSFVIGGRIQDDNRNFNGKIVGYGIWSRILSDAEVASLADGFMPECFPEDLIFAPDLIQETIDPVSGASVTEDGTSASTLSPKLIRCK